MYGDFFHLVSSAIPSESVAVALPILEGLGSNLGPDTDYSD
jgi:hypothetical protein